MPDACVELLERLSEPPLTLLHGDYRLDNLFFDPGAEDPVVAIDWQICGLGRSPYDIAYFMSQSLSPEDRKVADEQVLRTYYDSLRGRRGRGLHLRPVLGGLPPRDPLLCLLPPQRRRPRPGQRPGQGPLRGHAHPLRQRHPRPRRPRPDARLSSGAGGRRCSPAVGRWENDGNHGGVGAAGRRGHTSLVLAPDSVAIATESGASSPSPRLGVRSAPPSAARRPDGSAVGLVGGVDDGDLADRVAAAAGAATTGPGAEGRRAGAAGRCSRPRCRRR